MKRLNKRGISFLLLCAPLSLSALTNDDLAGRQMYYADSYFRESVSFDAKPHGNTAILSLEFAFPVPGDAGGLRLGTGPAVYFHATGNQITLSSSADAGDSIRSFDVLSVSGDLWQAKDNLGNVRKYCLVDVGKRPSSDPLPSLAVTDHAELASGISLNELYLEPSDGKPGAVYLFSSAGYFAKVSVSRENANLPWAKIISSKRFDVAAGFWRKGGANKLELSAFPGREPFSESIGVVSTTPDVLTLEVNGDKHLFRYSYKRTWGEVIARGLALRDAAGDEMLFNGRTCVFVQSGVRRRGKWVYVGKTPEGGDLLIKGSAIVVHFQKKESIELYLNGSDGRQLDITATPGARQKWTIASAGGA